MTFRMTPSNDDHFELGWMWRPEGGFRWESDLVSDRVLNLGLVPQGNAIPFRPPTGRRFLDDFAALTVSWAAQPDQLDAIRHYADRFGWLGEEVAVSRHSEVFRAGEPHHFWAEPLAAWVEHVGKVRDLLHTIEEAGDIKTDIRASQPNSSQLRSLRTRFEWQLDVAGEGALIYKYGSGRKSWWADEAKRGYGISPDLMPSGKLADVARFFVGAVVEEELAAVHVLRQYQGRPALRVAFPAELKGAPELTPVALHGALYLGVAQALFRGRLPRRECEKCHRPFYPTRTTRRFCGNTCVQAARRKAKKLTTVGDDNAWSNGEKP